MLKANVKKRWQNQIYEKLSAAAKRLSQAMLKSAACLN
jgi:hypothetical protein